MNLDWGKRSVYCYLACMLCLSVLNSCVVADNEPMSDLQQATSVKAEAAATSTPTLLPTSKSTLLNTATVSPILTNPLEEHTPTPALQDQNNESQEQEAKETDDACVDITLIFENSENSEVRWRFENGGEAYCCESTGVDRIYRNPGSNSSLAVYSVVTNGTVPVYTTNILVYLITGTSKVLGHDYIDMPKYLVDWLTDEKFVWADEQGEMFMGSMDTQETLNAPAKMTDLWFVPPHLVLTRDEALHFWYFDLINSVWTQLPAEESEKITWGWIDYAAVSDDSDYVFFFFEDYSAILSVASRTIQTVTPTFTSEDKYYVVADAMEGEIFSPLQQIKGTPYWFFRTQWIFREFSQISYPTRGFVVDSRTGKVVDHEILGIPSEVAIYNSYLSPDRMWVATEVVEAIQTLETAAAQVSQTWFINLFTGEVHVEDGKFESWEVESQAYLNAPLACTEQEMTIGTMVKTAVFTPTSTAIPTILPTSTHSTTQLVTPAEQTNATVCLPPPGLLETEVDIVADPFCIVWVDDFTDETGFQIVLEYPQSGEQFVYETEANITQFVVPEADRPRLTESLEQCMRRNAFMVQVVALISDNKQKVGGLGANIECGGPGSQPLPTATPAP